jgi:SIR2-like domain
MTSSLSLQDRLEEHFDKFQTAPFLFVGSGISRRYLNLEDWQGLLRKFAELCGSPYEYYYASANGVFPQIGTEIARALHPIWWKDKRFEESRTEFGKDAKTSESAFKVEISKYLRDKHERLPEDGELRQEVEALRKVVIDGVVTTNWDLLLDALFPEFKVFVGQDDVLFSAPQGVGEIYKIHGSCSAPNSLVVTSADYERFKERNPYLAAKLLAIFVEHPVVFLGYSLSDENIIEILTSISSCLTTENIARLQERLLFVQWAPKASEYEFGSSTIVASGHHVPVLNVRTPTFLPVYEALGAVKRKFPARLLRQLKEQVYALVRERQPTAKLYVQEIDADTATSDIDVVFGVGVLDDLRPAKTGYKAFTRHDLLEDVLREKSLYSPQSIVNDTLPGLLRNATYVPVFRYLREAGYLDDAGGLLKAAKIDPRVERAATSTIVTFAPPQSYSKRQKQFAKVKSFKEFASETTAHEVVTYAACLPEKALIPEEIKEFIIKHRDLLTAANSFDNTQFIKLVCMYDLLQYKRARKS